MQLIKTGMARRIAYKVMQNGKNKFTIRNSFKPNMTAKKKEKEKKEIKSEEKQTRNYLGIKMKNMDGLGKKERR